MTEDSNYVRNSMFDLKKLSKFIKLHNVSCDVLFP